MSASIEDKRGDVLVVGGGIGGMQASLDLAKSGCKVFLLEKSSVIGGAARELCCKGPGKCNECSLCEVWEKVFQVTSYPYISIIRNAEILYVEGSAGNFTVKVKSFKPDERRFPVYGASYPVRLEEYEESEIKVRAIILAGGFENFDPHKKAEYGYGRHKNCLTALELERMIHESGRIKIPSSGKKPHSIAFIQCIGSRDMRRGREYCSSICCTFALKEALAIKEILEDVAVSLFFYDMRPYGKDTEKFYQEAQEKGVKFIRSGVWRIEELEDLTLEVCYVDESGKHLFSQFDMLVFSTGIEPSSSAEDLAGKLGIDLSENGFFPTRNLPGGIFACGTFTGPKDFPETAMEASAVAGDVLLMLKDFPRLGEKIYPLKKEVGGEIRIGVFLCGCNRVIGGMIDVSEVKEHVLSLPEVAFAEEVSLSCSEEGRERIKQVIKEKELNRVVVGGCTPKINEKLFQEMMKELGLNPYLLEIANIREQCCWCTKEPKEATEKAKDLVRMAVAKARTLEPVDPSSFPINHSGLVIGGGISGMESSLYLAERGFSVYLVEKEAELGGIANRIYSTIEGMDIQAYLEETKRKVLQNPSIRVYTSCQIHESSGHVGDFTTKISVNGRVEELRHGVTIIATGAREFKPKEYLYGQDARVLTLLELEGEIARGESRVRFAHNLVIILCVGSREEGRNWCSRVCCTQGIKCALKFKEINSRANVYVLYRDIRAYGFKESYYRRAREEGVIFIRYEPPDKPQVSITGEGEGSVLQVHISDPLLGEGLIIEADVLALGVAAIPAEDNEFLSKPFKISLNDKGFFAEDYSKLSTVDSIQEGIFITGLADWPKFIEESVTQAKAASQRAAEILSREFIEAESVVAEVDERLCSGCGICESLCPYSAIKVNRGRKVAEVDEALCKGCGICCAACPSGAAQQRGFKTDQINSMVEACLSLSGKEGF